MNDVRDIMRNSAKVLNSLNRHSKDLNYKYERLYRILFNTEMYAVAYQRIAPKQGNMTEGTDGKTIDGMSLPRDTMINVDRKGSGHRLNAVYNYNKGSDPDTQVQKGMAALKKEVGKLTGITPDFYVMVQWEAVGEMVDALGGVYFDVPFDMDYDDPTPGQDLHIHLKEGYQKLDGNQAMGLIRWRHNNDFSVQYPTGDLGRMETQQAFLKAVAAECLKPSTLLKAPALAEVFMENVTTDLSLGNILAFAQLAAGMDAEQNVNFVSMPWVNANYPGVSMVLPAVDELLEILNDGFNPYLSDIQSTDLQVLVRNSDGSYSVTSGTLLDTSLNSSRGSSSSGSSGNSSRERDRRLAALAPSRVGAQCSAKRCSRTSGITGG